jgi:hypothetical protein
LDSYNFHSDNLLSLASSEPSPRKEPGKASSSMKSSVAGKSGLTQCTLRLCIEAGSVYTKGMTVS